MYWPIVMLSIKRNPPSDCHEQVGGGFLLMEWSFLVLLLVVLANFYNKKSGKWKVLFFNLIILKISYIFLIHFL